LQDFSILLGNDILGSRGDGSPLGAFLEEAGKFDWDIFPTIDARALPGPSPAPEVLELFFREFESRVAQDAGEIDAVFLVLHGAMAIENIADVEGDFLSRIRRNPKLASVPIFGVKAAVAHRRAYDPIVRATYTVRTPDPCTRFRREAAETGGSRCFRGAACASLQKWGGRVAISRPRTHWRQVCS